MNPSKLGYWTFVVLTTAISVGMLAAGIGLSVRYILVNDPPPAIPRSALPATTPEPHAHCATFHPGVTIPGHRLRIRPRDRRGFDLALQKFTHQHDGCSRRVSRFIYRVSLPPIPMRQILELDRHNYDQWAVAALADNTTVPNRNHTGRTQLELYINQSAAGYAPDLTITAGMFLAGLGLLACFGSLIICVETARYRPAPAKQTATL